MKATDAAWLAGLIDGEGHIDVPRCRVTMSNCDLALLRECQKVAGCGGVYTHGKPRRHNHRRSYQWNVGSKADVVRLLASVQSRLITKRAKCRAVLRKYA